MAEGWQHLSSVSVPCKLKLECFTSSYLLETGMSIYFQLTWWTHGKQHLASTYTLDFSLSTGQIEWTMPLFSRSWDSTMKLHEICPRLASDSVSKFRLSKFLHSLKWLRRIVDVPKKIWPDSSGCHVLQAEPISSGTSWLLGSNFFGKTGYFRPVEPWWPKVAWVSIYVQAMFDWG